MGHLFIVSNKMIENAIKGYNSCVDFPSSSMTEELFQLNPDAKVILSLREDFDTWYDSASNTILKSIVNPENPRKELYARMQYKWFAAFTTSKKLPQTKEDYKGFLTF